MLSENLAGAPRVFHHPARDPVSFCRALSQEYLRPLPCSAVLSVHGGDRSARCCAETRRLRSIRIPVLGPLLVVVIDAVAALAAILLWCVLVAKAWRGETFKIPLLGDFAERYAGEF